MLWHLWPSVPAAVAVALKKFAVNLEETQHYGFYIYLKATDRSCWVLDPVSSEHNSKNLLLLLQKPEFFF